MSDFSAGDEFSVTEETIRLNQMDLPVEAVRIESIESDDNVRVVHLGDHPELPITLSVTASDISQALGDWLAKS